MTDCILRDDDKRPQEELQLWRQFLCGSIHFNSQTVRHSR